MNASMHIGTSGWHYDHWRGRFYPPDLPAERMLAFYAGHFASVEINNSFYHLPTPAALAGWREATPPSFVFAAKASRYITHMKKLKDPESGLGNLLPRMEVLGEKLGPILFQLPPRWRLDMDRLAAFLAALPAGHRYAFELRDPSWHALAVYQLLAEHGVAHCIYDLGGYQSPLEITADFAYVRLHGPGGAYQGSYSAETLAAWAARIAAWRERLRAVYVYFDNDEAGCAVRNALDLRSLVETAASKQQG